MASTKSTVVGIRLDHERRAWVEAEAARRGVSMRGLFEGMIDEARSGGSESASRADDGSGAPVRPGPGSSGEHATPGGEEDSSDRVSAGAPPPGDVTPQRGLVPDLGSMAALPAELLRGACSLTVGVIESSARCAVKRLGGCVLTRHRGGGSV
jgi:hypothetical protein